MQEVFVGLVTHPRSRFDADGAATRQAGDLVAALADGAAGLLISDRDDADPATYPLDRAELLRSARHQARLEHAWRRYLAAAGGRPARGPVLDRLAAAAMELKRQAETGALLPGGDGVAGRRAATRLLNIDLSHLRVLEAGVASGAPWVLVLEDDARATDVPSTAAALLEGVDALTATEVAFVSLSESIALERLGVDGLLDGPLVAGGPDWLVRARTPITNTVCANLYRASFASALADGIRSRGLVPVAPIDWRVNEQVLAMVADGRLGPGSCAWAQPGLFLQGSMHTQV